MNGYSAYSPQTKILPNLVDRTESVSTPNSRSTFSPPNLVDHPISPGLKSILSKKNMGPNLIEERVGGAVPTPKVITWSDKPPTEIGGPIPIPHKKRSKPKKTRAVSERPKAPEPSPTEDLMREHGLLDRILLIYEHYIIKIGNGAVIDYDILLSACQIVREFIEDYHEPMEEKHIFAPLLLRNIEVETINELIKQHRISKVITDKTIKYIKMQNAPKVQHYLRMFIWMYKAHETVENTVIFDKFRSISTTQSLHDLGEEFEKSEQARFGSDGYEGILKRIIQMEKKMGIDSLQIYTPLMDI